MRGFPKTDEQVYNAEPGDRSAKPRRSHYLTQARPANEVGDKNEQVIFAPTAEDRIPRSKDQIKAKQQAQHYEKNYSKSFDHNAALFSRLFLYVKNHELEKFITVSPLTAI
jgi:hypothetical protein